MCTQLKFKVFRNRIVAQFLDLLYILVYNFEQHNFDHHSIIMNLMPDMQLSVVYYLYLPDKNINLRTQKHYIKGKLKFKIRKYEILHDL